MPTARPYMHGFANSSILLSVVSSALLLFFCFSDSKLFVILTTAPALSVIAGIIAIAVIAYELLRMRAVSTRSWAALALALSVYAFGDFVMKDYAGGYSIVQ